GNMPFGISVSPDGSKVYVGNQFSNTVSVINTATNAVTDAITVSNMPIGISVSPDGSKVYVTLAGYPGKVDVINTATNTVTATIIVINPQGVTVSPDGSKVYVTNDSTNTVTVINTATDTVMATISVGNTPEGISVSPDGSKVYVANTNSNTVSVINTASNTITATITVGNMPFGISVSPDGSKVYVANSISNTVSVINTGSNTVTDSIKVGSGPTTFGNFISTYIQPTACQASFGYDTINTYPNTINFTDYSSGYINSWLWTFGDSTSSTAQNPVHTYLNNGTYTVCLTASDIDSSGHVVCSSTYCTIIVVGNPPTTCQAYFEYYSDTTNTNIVDFYDYSSWYSSGNINSWLWTFGDSTSSTLQNPVHTYAGNGAYTVCLTASDIDSSGVLCSNTYCTTVVIGNPPTNCQAYYGYYVDTTHANVIDFYDYSGLYSSGNINSWYWTFGDSTSSTLQNPVHTYANYGQYEVCLTASDIDTNGNVICSSTYCNWVYDNSYSDSLYSIQGTIYADGTPTNAAVILFNTDHWYYNAVGYENATGGVFEFDNIKLGHYILWAIPDTTMSPVYLPTYFGDVLYWQNAYDSLYINANTYNVNIHLVPLDSASGHQKVMTGNGSISGTVKFDNNLTYEVNIFDQNWFGPTGSGGNTYSNIAGKNIPVFLKNTSGNILDWALAKADGGFTF
ncbi:MAG: PKD domain-containing protein, partial [Bacteroidales bacterium]